MQSHMKVTHALDVKCLKMLASLWSRSVKADLIAKNVYGCITSAEPGTKCNEVAMSVLLEKIPEPWAEEVVFMESAKEAFEWLENKYKRGHNQDLIFEWSDQVDNGKMTPGHTLNDYVVFEFGLARGLKENQSPVTNSRLNYGLVKGLPREFETQKANL